MEKIKTGSQPERDNPYSPKDLKSQAILNAFDTIDLDEKRELLSELFKRAKMVNANTPNNISPDFIRWICSGKRVEWKQEDVERAWEMWNFLYRRTRGGALHNAHTIRQYVIIWNANHYGNYEYEHEPDKFYDSRDEDEYEHPLGTMTIEKTRESFFKLVLEKYTPDEFDINLNVDPDSDDDVIGFMDYIEKGTSFADFRKILESPDVGGYEHDLVPDPRFK